MYELNDHAQMKEIIEVLSDGPNAIVQVPVDRSTRVGGADCLLLRRALQEGIAVQFHNQIGIAKEVVQR